jgi:signal peptidase I
VAFDVQVPLGKLWLMGDRRSESRDSRDHLGEPGGGFVPEEQVIGRAEWLVYPVGHWQHLRRPAAYDTVDEAERDGRHGHQG